MSAPPPVSIGLPVYNGERFLPQTLADLLGQTYPDFELVVCDNASTDQTEALVREAAAHDPRVRYHRNARNRGALPNANRAFALSRGARYVLAGHDDRHAPGFLARLVVALDDDPGAALAYGDATLIGEDDRPFRFRPDRGDYLDAAGHRYDYDAALQRPLPGGPVDRYRAVLRSNDVNAPIHGLYRRDVLERIGPHRVHGSDRLIVAHAALLGRFAYVDAPLFGYRIHTASTLHLTRTQWLERETGRTDVGSATDGARTLGRYLAATGRADLGGRQRAAAVAATLGYAVRADALRRIVLPGPDNYWGWDRSSASAPRPAAPLPASAVGERWAWLLEGKSEERVGGVESFEGLPA